MRSKFQFLFTLISILLISTSAQSSTDTKKVIGYLHDHGQKKQIVSAFGELLNDEAELRDKIDIRFLTEEYHDDVSADQLLDLDLLVIDLGILKQSLANLISETRNRDLILITVGETQVPESLNRLKVIDNELVRAFWRETGLSNQQGLLKVALNALGFDNIEVPKPEVGLEFGFYYPDPSAQPGPIFSDWESFTKWRKSNGKLRDKSPKIGVGFYSSFYYGRETEVVDAVIQKIEDLGAEAVPYFGYPGHIATEKLLLDDNGEARVDAIVGLTFRFGSPDASSHLAPLNVPIINGITLYGRSEKEWRESDTGLSLFEGTFQIIGPELGGLLSPTVLGSQEPVVDPNTGISVNIRTPIPDQIEQAVNRALQWSALQRKANSDKKLALIYYNYPAGKANIGASYLNVAESLSNILQTLKDQGYDTGNEAIDTDSILQRLVDEAVNVGGYAPGELTKMVDTGEAVRVPLSQYQTWLDALHPSLKAKVIEDWGRPEESRLMATTERGQLNFIVPVVGFGKIQLMPQPARGWGEDNVQLYHADDLAPHHQYIAAYEWLKHEYQADAVIHMGTHGTLEWLDGKAMGLSAEDAPEALIGDLPNLYIYNVDVVGEGLVARRRGAAALIDHMVPPFVAGGVYAELAKLSELVDSYHNNLSKNPELAEVYAEEIRLLVMELGIDKDLELNLISIKEARELGMDIGLVVDHTHRDSNTAESTPTRNDDHGHSHQEAHEHGPEYGHEHRHDHSVGHEHKGHRHNSHHQHSHSHSDSHTHDHSHPHEQDHEHDHVHGHDGEHTHDHKYSHAHSDAPESHQHQDSQSQAASIHKPVTSVPEPAVTPKGDAKIIDHELLHEIQDYIVELRSQNIPYGLHAFGRTPQDEHIDTTVSAIINTDRSLIGDAQQRLSETVEQSIRDSGPRELSSLMNGLNGGYISGGNGGEPIRNPDVYPTGKNFYGIDPNKVPTEAAYQLGVALAETMLADHKKKHGHYPDKVSFVIWGNETLRHEGILESQIFHLLGTRPVWDSRGKLVDVDVISAAQLGRPRVDIVIASAAEGMFHNLTLMIDRAVQKVKAIDELDNYVRRNYLQTKAQLIELGYSEEDADQRAGVRIFDEPPGIHNLNTSRIVEASGTWDSEVGIAHDYIKKMGHGFGNGFWGEPMEDVFRLALEGADKVVHSSSTTLYGALDNDDFYMYAGGLVNAIGSIDGEQPELVVTNTRNPETPEMTDIDKFIGQEMRTRYINPKWIEGMQKEGYAGAGEMRAFIEYLWGWDATITSTVTDQMWQETFEVYIEDKHGMDLQTFFDQESPFALQDMSARMIEVVRKDYWQADDTTLTTLLETYLESVNRHGVGCSDNTCGNARLLNHILTESQRLQLPQDLIQQFQTEMEELLQGDISELARELEQFSAGNEVRINQRTAMVEQGIQPDAVEGYLMEEIEQNSSQPAHQQQEDQDQKLFIAFAILLIASLLLWRSRTNRKLY